MKHKFMSMLTMMLMIGIIAAQAIKVHTIGDSTMAQYDPNSTVTRGWGQYLQQFLEGVTVNNRGKGGASTRGFYEGENLWPSVKKQLSKGDYVLIQFAHNDEKSQGMDGVELKAYYTSIGNQADADKTPTTGTVPTGAYKQYLIKFVNETRAAGCIPILVSPICRKYFDGATIRRAGQHDLGDSFSKLTANGPLTGQRVPADDHSMDYPYQMKHVADSMGVQFIDLTTLTKNLFEKYGDARCNALFFDGQGSTHLNETGAMLVARLCAQQMKSQGILASDVNLRSELTVSPTEISLGSGFKGQTLTKQATVKGFDLSPEAGDVTLTATGGIMLSTDNTTWSTSIKLPYDASMIVSTFYVKYDITDDSNTAINGTVTATQGSQTVTLPVSGTIIKVDAAQAQDGVTATWQLGKIAESDMNATMSAEGLVSVASMTVGSDLTPVDKSVDGTPYYGFQPKTSSVADDQEADAITFTLTPKKGFTFEPTKFAFKASKFGTNAGQYDVIAAVGDKQVALATNITPNRSNDKTTAHFSDYAFDISDLVAVGEPVTVKIYIKKLANNKQHGIRDVVLTGNFSGKAEQVRSFTLNVSNPTPEAGTVTVNPNGTIFDEGTEVTLSTTENFGYHFLGWEDADGNYVSERNPYSFTIDHNMNLKAAYQKATVYSLDLNTTDGALDHMVKIEPEGNVVDGLHQYENGTEVKLTATNNKILTFTSWDDKSTNPERTIKMDGDKQVTAHYSAADYIVGWDFYEDAPKSERAADFKSDTENAGLLSLHNDAGTTTSWLSRGHENGQARGKYGASCWRNIDDKYFFEISFSTKNYKHVTVSSLLGNDYNSYARYYEQASTDGKTYTTVGTFDMPERAWTDVQDIVLPDEFNDKDRVYVRWYPDAESGKVGVASTNDGLTLGEVYVLGESSAASDDTAPILVSSNPENNATGVSATGSIILSFDEKIKAGNGTATLDGETLQPIISGKTAIYKYGPLKYNTTYTFSLSKGAVTDRNGNAFGGMQLTFTTMQRTQPDARLYDAVVAQDGTGDYLSLQDAITAAPEGRTSPWLIFVKKGNYTGHVTIPANKPYIHIIGQGKNLVTISDNRLSGGDKAYGISDGATMDIEADHVYLEGVDLQNSYGVEQNNGPQALALCSNGDKLIMNNMKLRSYQDTWYTGGSDSHRAFITNSWVEGAVDFFYGKGDVMVTSDTVNIVRKSGAYIVAPNHGKNAKWGYVFLNNVITAPGDPSQTSVWLGRPWHEYPKTLFINTKALVTIPATGWYETMGGLPALWAEYNTMDKNGNPVDLSQRRTEYYYTDADGNKVYGHSETAVLTAEQAAQYTVKNVCGQDDAWNPELTCEPCAAPVVTVSQGSVTWLPVDYAICYVVSKGNDVVAITTSTSCPATEDGAYTVQAVNEFGGLSKPARASVTVGLSQIETDAHSGVQAVYSVDGKQQSGGQRGISIVKYKDGMKRKVLRK